MFFSGRLELRGALSCGRQTPVVLPTYFGAPSSWPPLGVFAISFLFSSPNFSGINRSIIFGIAVGAHLQQLSRLHAIGELMKRGILKRCCLVQFLRHHHYRLRFSRQSRDHMRPHTPGHGRLLGAEPPLDTGRLRPFMGPWPTARHAPPRSARAGHGLCALTLARQRGRGRLGA